LGLLLHGSTPVLILHSVCEFIGVPIQFGLTWGNYLGTSCDVLVNFKLKATLVGTIQSLGVGNTSRGTCPMQ